MIMPRIKKVLSIMLVLVMCITYLPFSYDYVHAEETASGEESSTNEGTTYTYIPSLPDGTNSQRLSGSKCYLDDTKYFWVNADAESEMDAVDIIKKDRSFNFYMEDGSIGYYPYMLKAGSKMTSGRLNFTVSEGKYCKLVTYLYVQNGTYVGYAVYRASDDSLVEGSERYVYDDDWKYNAVYNLEPGDYYIAKNGDYDASLNFFRLDAVETDKPVEINTERKDWNDVQKPRITDCYSYNDYIYVRYDMPMGTDGADYIEATLIDSDGNEYMTRRSAMPAYRRLLSFVVDRSDEYTCTIKAVRYTGEEKEGYSCVYDYSYPLAQPKPFIAYNIGDGVVKIEYSEVKEAYSYTVEYKGTSDSDWSVGAVSNKGEAVIYGLDVGKEYEFRVIAHRKGESASSDEVYENANITVSDEAGAGWVRESLAGNYATPNYSYVDGDLNKEDTVTLYSEAGKIVRNGADGIVSTYTKIKASSNFSFSAHANVLYWSNKSDQNGFGIYVSDQNYELTKGWNNALQLGAMKVTNATEQEPAFDHRIGIGYTYKYGCDSDALNTLTNDSAIDSKIDLSTLGMYKEQKVLEEREQYKNCDYMIGNVNESSIGSGYTKGDITEFDIKLEKTGNVYTMTYTSADGTYSNTKSVDVGDAFTALDEDYIYVGLFAGRQSTHVKFSDVKFEVNDDADYSKVDEAIAKAGSLDRNEYEDFGQVDEIIKTIERGLKSDCQGKVLIMAKKLYDAINSLKLKKKEITNDDGTTTTISSTDTIKGGEKIEVTGDKEESYVSIKSEPGENAVESEIKAGSEQELIDSVLTDDEKSQVENGESVSISLKVENDSIGKNTAKEIEKVIKKSETDSGKKIGALLDISIEKTIGKKLLGTRELNSEIELSIDVPASLEKVIKEDGKTYKVARNHEGIVDLIDAVYNAADNKLTFKTDRFSTYALLYEPVETPLAIESSYSEDDKTVKFTAQAEGGQEGYTYKFIVYNKTTRQWGLVQNFSSNNTCTWTKGSAGDRDFYVDVKDAAGNIVRSKAMNIKIENNKPTAALTGSTSSISSGGKLTLTASTNADNCTYKFIIYNPGTDQWFKLQDFSSNNTFTWTAGSNGTRQFYVDVKDAAGNVTRSKVLNVSVGGEGALSVKTTVSTKTSNVGDKIIFTAEASGDKAGYTYKMVVYNSTTKMWGLVQNFNANNKITWTAGSAGDREFYIDVKDADGNVVRSSVMNVKTSN